VRLSGGDFELPGSGGFDGEQDGVGVHGDCAGVGCDLIDQEFFAVAVLEYNKVARCVEGVYNQDVGLERSDQNDA
jgi:hypothetical protein